MKDNVERSAFYDFIHYNFLFVFAPQGLLFPTRGKVDGKGSPFGEGGPSPRECPTPPPLLFEAGAGNVASFAGRGRLRKRRVSGDGEVETGRL